MMNRTRSQVAAEASTKLLAGRAGLKGRPGLVGFDGFVDSIIAVVDQRASMSPKDYRAIPTIRAFADRCAAAAGKSTNLEMVVHEDRFGGNGPLMAGGLAKLGLPTTYIGAVGQESDPDGVHDLYEELERRCQASGGGVIPLAPPARTAALEFSDGKIMLGDPRNVQRVDWALLKGRFGLDGLTTRIASASLLAVVNWVMMQGVQGILDGLADEVFAHLAQRGHEKKAPAGATRAASGPVALSTPRVFIDLCDPAKRTDEDIRRVLATLRRLAVFAPVTLGLNLAESERIDAVSGAGGYAGVVGHPSGAQIRTAAERLRAALAVDCVVIHPREGAGGASADGRSAWFDGPLVAQPKISTGAGDHFNAGFALAQVLGLDLEECLAVGCAESGVYVRDGESPTLERLAEFLATLPSPER
jgi:sugar/nucleoside kinase (ribokinase family)